MVQTRTTANVHLMPWFMGAVAYLTLSTTHTYATEKGPTDLLVHVYLPLPSTSYPPLTLLRVTTR